MSNDKSSAKEFPKQEQSLPGSQQEQHPSPKVLPKEYPNGKLAGKVAIITGADSGIGQAVAILFAKEGADVVVSYLCEDDDAKMTKKHVESYQQRCLLVASDLSEEANCQKLIDTAIAEFGKIDILVNNAGMQVEQESLTDISSAQFDKTIHTNFYPHFWLSKFALPHMPGGSSIINTTSITAYRGSDHLIDYAATKGAILSFTRALANNLMSQDKGIRVNGVAPGPIWTPLIVASFTPDEIEKFGQSTPMGRAGQPNEVAPAYLYLASDDASYVTGQVIHVNGGEIVGG
ncbi:MULTISPECIES: glucose 1-dehydrogenase [Psychrobacter]|uniref:Glucose 1-dehydrogenase n=1 Tax=Psychrobacter communis TaxID=2762238 RepID=A0ABR8RGX8_9GAMM|nr:MULTISPECIES: glucose 1-dehydrogenase [Psychrobacter]MBD7946986.1 glucose 1-dehydrogenase [Psychrobacter communis]MBK3392620.1 glucose 1-dehydrogenase [Psychrobacter sp. M9-54-1]